MTDKNKWMIDPNEPYRALMESYDKAQSVQKVGHETKLDHAAAPAK